VSARLLVVAGHDPSHGAGVEADREAAARFGVEARCVVTVWTDQDGRRVRSIGVRPATEWLAEARTALAEEVHALKSGLLPGAEAVRALARLIDELPEPRVPVVVDPVLAASGGEILLDDEGIEMLLGELLPRGVILTPNLPELARLTGVELESDRSRIPVRSRERAAARLLERGCRAVLVKGGHAPGERLADLVLERDEAPVWLERARIQGRGIHGSGCRYASAVAAQLALALPLSQAAEAAGNWVGELIRAARPR